MNEDLERNLKLTPQQRIEEHQKALNLVLELEKASARTKNPWWRTILLKVRGIFKV